MPEAPRGRTSKGSRPKGNQQSAVISIEMLHNQLRSAIESIETGEQWRAWLHFAGSLHHYSFNNVILIWAQRPDATAVASYTTWHSLNRQVRRGEKALRVMAPILRRAAIADQNGNPVLDADGGQQLKQQIVGFRPVPVFDVAQTDGPPLPEPQRPVLLTGQAPVGLWDALVREVSERGYRLMRGPIAELGGANGVTRLAEREVWIRDDVDDAQAVKTLAHELAHVMLHAPTDGENSQTDCAGIREVEAESVAHLVMAAHHLDTGAYSFPYVATWAYPLAAVDHVSIVDIVTRTGTRVMKAASQIINATATATATATAAASSPADPAMLALTARVAAGAQQAVDLRDKVSAATLPPVDPGVLLGVIAESHDFFRRQASRSWVPDYLAERHLAEAVHTHQVGYAPKQWTTLTDHLRGLGYADDHMEAAGMAIRTRNGHLVDRFRDRMTIPLHDDHGALVGFTARLAPHHTEDRDGPKYLNSPTTAVFRKKELLYGLGDHRTKIAAGHLPVLCEGPLDAIAIDLLAVRTGAYLVGVAACGTAFTDHHARHLTAAVGDRPICLALDADPAGQVATEATWRKLTDQVSREIVIADLPTGSDPASLYSLDPQALLRQIGSARQAGWVIAERQIDGAHLDDNCLRELTAFRGLMTLAQRVPTWQRSGYLLRLAEKLRIDPVDAAVEIAERHPNMLIDRALAHCRQLEEVLLDLVPPGEMLAAPESNSDTAVSRTHIAPTTR